MMINRTQTADLLKGIAVLLMIQVHIIELFASEEIYNSSIGKVLLFLGGPPVAPLFMVVFGYFIAASNKSMWQLIARGVKIIALGMFLNIALNLNLILHVNRGELQIDLWPYIFGVDILQFAGLAIIIIALIKKVIENNLFALFMCILISTFLGNFLSNITPDTKVSQYIFSFLYGCSKWSYFPIFPWIAYPLSGIALYQFQKKNGLSDNNKSILDLFIKQDSQRFFKQIAGAVFFAFIVYTLKNAIFIASNLPLYYHHEFVFAMWTLIFLAFYSFVLNEINQFAGEFILFRYIKWLGKNVTIIYILQWLLIGNTATEIYKTVTSPMYLLIYFFAVLGIASGICYALLMIKARLIQNATSS